MPIDLATIVTRKENLLTTPADNDLVILNLESDHYVGLDAVGRRIWELLETPQQVGELCQQLGQEFNGPAEAICRDVLKFLSELEREGLIHARDGG